MDNIRNLKIKISQNKNIDIVDLDGEKVMMDLEKGQYLALNEIGTKIWDMIAEPIMIKDVILNLMSEYEVDEEDCKEDIMEFIGRLNGAGLIQIS